MLKVTIGIALLLIIALIGYRKTFTRLHLPIGARYIFLTGTEFILVGLALGGGLIGLLDAKAIRSLTPLFSLALGFIGLIFGIQLELDKIKRFPTRYAFIALIQAVVTMGVVFFPTYFLMQMIFGTDGETALLASAVLAATAGCTGVTTIALLGQELRLRSTPLMELLRYISSLDAVVALVAIGLAFCMMHTHSPFGSHVGAGLFWFALSLVIGVAMGALLKLFTQFRCTEEELLIFVIGMVLFSAGLAQYLKLSPLFVCMVMGITMANLPGAPDRIFYHLAQLEKPFYIVLLILAGTMWRIESQWAWLVAAAYLCLRLGGKTLGGYLATRLKPGDLRAPPETGLGLISHGGIAVAIVVNYYQVFSPGTAGPSGVAGAVVTSVLTAVIIFELVSPTLTRNVLDRAGEIET